MASVTQKFVLVGPHKGKTMTINGHDFVDGEYDFAGSSEQVSNLTRVFRRYAALPEQQAELEALKAELSTQLEPQQPQASLTSVGGSNDKEPPTVPGKPSLAEAIGSLSWEQEGHWTSNNLPSVEVLSELTGRKVARADVEAVAAGYTRAKAKSLAVQQ